MFEKIKSFFVSLEFKILSVSILLTLFVASCISYGIYLWKGVFWPPFFITIGIQYVGFIVINSIIQKKEFISMSKLENETLETLSKISIQVQCAYCKKNNIVPVFLNRDNRFPCEHCGQVNGIKLQFFTTQLTTPIETTKNPLENIVAKISDTPNQIQEPL